MTFEYKHKEKSRNKYVKELFPHALGIHHAGMLRSDRTLTERLFEEGIIKVLCCTATLAWGSYMIEVRSKPSCLC
jgi:replicative superfamily II helicase